MGQTFAVPINTSTSIATAVSDVSSALATLQSSFSGSSAPTTPTPVAGQQFFDTDSKALEVYDGASWRSQSGRVAEATTPVGNVSTGEQTLQTTTVPAGIIALTGQRVVATALVLFAANANAKTAKVRLGSTALTTVTNTGSNAETVLIEVEIVRTGATSQVAIVRVSTDDGTTRVVKVARVTASETWANALAVDTRGDATNNDDVVSHLLLVRAVV